MSFLHPGVLYALLLGSVPILIYYLMRFRSQRVGWGAEYILRRALERLRKKLYWDQILLLALRALAMLALAFAFARPVVRGAAERLYGAGVRRVVIFDATASMQAEENGQTRWKRSVEALHALVGLWGRGGEWSLLVFDDQPRWLFQRRPVESAAGCREAIETLRPGEGAGRIGDALAQALTLDDGRPLELYLFADDQAAAWREAAAAFDGRALGHIRFHWICPSLVQRRNLGVTAVELGHSRVLRGHPFAIHAEVANFSAEAVTGAEVAFLIDGAPVGSQRVSLQPWQRVWVRGEAVSETPGSHAVTVRLAADALAPDNRMSAGFEAADRLRVGVVADPARAGRFVSSLGFLKQAAGVLAGAEWGGGVLEVEALDPAAADPAPLAACDVVVLDGGSTLTDGLAVALDRYVRSGGALVAAADEAVDAAVWNTVLEGRGLLPARVGAVTREPLGGERFRRLGLPWYGGPATRGFETEEDRAGGRVRFYSWRFVEPLPGGEVRHVFDDQSPYHVEKRFERGTVQLLAAGLTGKDNALFVRESLYPYLVRLFSGAAARSQYPLAVRRGAPVRVFVGGGEPVTGAQVVEEAADAVATVQPVARDGGWVLAASEGTRASGLASMLVLRGGGHSRIWVGVQGDCADSDLTALDEGARADLAALTGWTESADAAQLVEAVRRGADGREWYPWVMAACLVFLMGELVVGLRFV